MSYRIHRHESPFPLFFCRFPFSAHFSVLQFPSRRAKLPPRLREREWHSSCISFRSSPFLLLPFLRRPRFSFSRLSRRRRKQSGFPRVIKRLHSTQKGLTVRFFARHLLSDSVLPSFSPFLSLLTGESCIGKLFAALCRTFAILNSNTQELVTYYFSMHSVFIKFKRHSS